MRKGIVIIIVALLCVGSASAVKQFIEHRHYTVQSGGISPANATITENYIPVAGANNTLWDSYLYQDGDNVTFDAPADEASFIIRNFAITPEAEEWKFELRSSNDAATYFALDEQGDIYSQFELDIYEQDGISSNWIHVAKFDDNFINLNIPIYPEDATDDALEIDTSARNYAGKFITVTNESGGIGFWVDYAGVPYHNESVLCTAENGLCNQSAVTTLNSAAGWDNSSVTFTETALNVNISGTLSLISEGANANMGQTQPLEINSPADEEAIRIYENNGAEYYDIGTDHLGNLVFVNDAGDRALTLWDVGPKTSFNANLGQLADNTVDMFALNVNTPVLGVKGQTGQNIHLQSWGNNTDDFLTVDEDGNIDFQDRAINIGDPDESACTGTEAVCLGGDSDAKGDYSVVIGDDARDGGNRNVVIGADTNCDSATAGGICVGSFVLSKSQGALCSGYDARCGWSSSQLGIVGLGAGVRCEGNRAVCIGYQTETTSAASYAFAMAYLAKVAASHGIAVGNNAEVGTAGGYGQAWGAETLVNGSGAQALGAYSQALAADCSVLGRYSNCTHQDSIVLANYGASTSANQLMVGAANDERDTYIHGDLEATKNATLNFYYAEMTFHNDSGETFTIAAQDVYYNLTLMEQGYLNGFTYSGGILTALEGGKYKVDYTISFGGGANDEYHMAVGINGVEQDNCHIARLLGAGGDLGNAGGTCIISVSDNDDISLMVENEDDADDIDVQDANINLVRIGS